jgi:hypothetical protein
MVTLVDALTVPGESFGSFAGRVLISEVVRDHMTCIFQAIICFSEKPRRVGDGRLGMGAVGAPENQIAGHIATLWGLRGGNLPPFDHSGSTGCDALGAICLAID